MTTPDGSDELDTILGEYYASRVNVKGTVEDTRRKAQAALARLIADREKAARLKLFQEWKEFFSKDARPTTYIDFVAWADDQIIELKKGETTDV